MRLDELPKSDGIESRLTRVHTRVIPRVHVAVIPRVHTRTVMLAQTPHVAQTRMLPTRVRDGRFTHHLDGQVR